MNKFARDSSGRRLVRLREYNKKGLYFWKKEFFISHKGIKRGKKLCTVRF